MNAMQAEGAGYPMGALFVVCCYKDDRLLGNWFSIPGGSISGLVTRSGAQPGYLWVARSGPDHRARWLFLRMGKSLSCGDLDEAVFGVY